MKVLALSDSLAPWHSFWIRIGQYLPALPWPAEITDNPAAIDNLCAGDRLLVYRYAPGWGDLANRLQRARERGVVILSDLDDYLWQAQGWSRERLLGCTRALRQCEILTCSTEPLLTQLQVMFPHLKLELLPNSAPQISQQVSPPPASPLRIGWTGAPWTRPADLALLRPLAQWIAARPNELQLVHVGHGEGRLSLAVALGLKPAQVEAKPLQGHGSYLQQLNFHIGLAPLSSSSFNHYKSAIKVIEYSALGIPWLASDAEPYRDLCRRWQWPGRLCSRPHDWIENSNRCWTRSADSRKEQPSRLSVNSTPASAVALTGGARCLRKAGPFSITNIQTSMFNVPDSAPTEDKAICQLVNAGMNPKQLYKAAYTFYRVALEEQLMETQPVAVQSGLFKGMVLFPGSLSSQLLPKWLGTYEAEVQGLLEEQARDCDCFIDIGCAEGFYLTGIARWLGIPCHGCDIDPRAHSATAYAAQQNGVAELVHLHASTASAVQAGTGRALILVDVDGHENEVLEELNQALSKTQQINEALLILETDQGQSSTQNTAQLITWLCQNQWNVIHIAHQNPQLRFNPGQSELSFLDQVVRGAEGRPGGQRWIMATKHTPQQRSNLASSSVA